MDYTPVSESTVYNRLVSRKNVTGYTEGTPWDNSNEYVSKVVWDGYEVYRGHGCFGFMMDMMEYASEYKCSMRKVYGTYNNLPQIHVGDGLRLENDKHSVVVLEVSSDGHTVTVAEANYGGTVHWGRVIDLSKVGVGFTYLFTFWSDTKK